MAKKTVLIILDGYGIGDGRKDDAISCTPTPYMDSLMRDYPHSLLSACGEDVGLPAGQMGNSEVGHLNIGAGRIVYQDLVKINRAIADGSIREMKEIKDAYEYCRDNGRALHLMGLVSTGGIHSSLDHLFALLDIARDYDLKQVYVHCFTDGRDTDPRSGAGFVREVEKHCAETSGCVASVIGRYYAMDRNNNWDRIAVAYSQLIEGTGLESEDLPVSMENFYKEDITDEFMKPIVRKGVDGRIHEDDAVIFFNYRNDRARQITTVLTQKEVDGMKPVKGLRYYCMTPYDDAFKGVHILFDKENVENTLAEYLSKEGKNQLHIAETEKYAHVTFFLNGGREQPWSGEDRILVNSPDVATYDLKPEMSAYEISSRLVSQIEARKYDFIVVNFANGDMVGHTGKYEAICKAVSTVDACVHYVVEACKASGYEAIIIADHGNADHALNEDGSGNTAHSMNPVPFIYVSDRKDAKVTDGRLADVAPSVLYSMGMKQPEEMSGHNLISE